MSPRTCSGNIHEVCAGNKEDTNSDKRKNVYVTGYSQADWGSCPMTAYEGGDEAFVVKILQEVLTPGIPLLLLLD